jgi:hypothetical protein
MKKFLLTLGRTTQFGLAGFMGMVISAQRFLAYSPDNDRSHGISLWILAGTFLLSAAYLILFCILRFLVK